MTNQLCRKFKGIKSEDFTFTKEQEQLTDYFLNKKIPGMIVYWSLGSGKTCLAIHIIDKSYAQYSKIYIFTSGSLRENFQSQYCQVCGSFPNEVSEKLEFITYNNTKLNALPEMENCLIVIDEAHNVIRGKMNRALFQKNAPQGSGIYSRIYDHLLASKNCRFIFMSGTPIISKNSLFYYFELMGLMKNESLFDKNVIFDQEKGHYLFSNQLLKKIKPYISHHYSESSLSIEKKFFDVFVRMSPQQDMAVKNEFERETALIKAGLDPKNKIPQSVLYLARARVQSTEKSNVLYPPDKETKEVEDLTEKEGGWISEETVNQLEMISPKLSAILKIIRKIPGKHAIYTNFVGKYGVEFISSILMVMKIPHFLFHGSLSDKERTMIKNELTKTDDSRVSILLITRAAGEGQNFPGFKTLHFMDQPADYILFMQIVGRFVRRSDISLKYEHEIFKIYRYYALGKNNKTPSSLAKTNLGNQYPDFKIFQVSFHKYQEIENLIGQLNSLNVVNK